MYRSVSIDGLATNTYLRFHGVVEKFRVDRRTSVQSFIERASFVNSRVPDGDLK